MVVVTFRSVVVAMVVLFASNNQQPTVILSIYEYPTIDNPYLVVEYIRGTSTPLRLCLTYDEGGGKVDCYFFGVYSYRRILYEQHVYGIGVGCLRPILLGFILCSPRTLLVGSSVRGKARLRDIPF